MFRKWFISRRSKKPSLLQRDVKGLTSSAANSAVHLITTVGASRSHFLGTTEIPEEVDWPHRSGRPLDFLACIDLDEVQSVMKTEWLPSTGLLLFFYDVEEQPWGFDPKDRDGWAVMHVRPDEPLKPCSARNPLGVSSGMKLCAIQSFPSCERASIAQLNMTNQELDAYADLCEKVFDGRPKHQLLGFPSPVQGDHMELEAQLASHGIYCGNEEGYNSPRAKELESGAKEWRLLLQLDSDESLGFIWGDVGMLYYWVRESDARRGDFSHVWLTSQCY